MTGWPWNGKGLTQGSLWWASAGTVLMVAGALILMVIGGVAGAAQGDIERVSVASNGDESDGGTFWDPAVSADGRYVAFSSVATNLVDGDDNGFEDVFVHDRETGDTTRVSVASTGTEGDDWSRWPAISANGRYVAFHSRADNLIPDDANSWLDVFVHDRETGETTLVSVSSSGEQGFFDSIWPSISADGRYVAFSSVATNLVGGDTNLWTDVFVHDRDTGETTRVSVSSSGEQGNNTAFYPQISADGQHIVFESHADNLIPIDNNGFQDVFVHDRGTGETTLVSVNTGGEQGGNGISQQPKISANGRYISFQSHADNLISNDTNGANDVFVHDRDTGQTALVSVNSAEEQANGASGPQSAISSDGRYVAFYSAASNLVEGDTNGAQDVFVRDRETGVLSRVSVDNTGVEGNGNSHLAAFSADSRYVAFHSFASNLVEGDTNNLRDVFVHQFLPDPPPPTTTTTAPPTTTTTAPPTTTTTQPVPPPPPFPPGPVDWFIDDDGHLFEGDINAIADVGVTKGCNPQVNDMFCPDRQVSRGETASFLARVMGLPPSARDRFTDDHGNVHEDSISRIATARVTIGCNPPANDEFCPNRSLTRAEMASLISQALNLPASVADHFGDDAGNVHEVNINRIAEAGITQGCNPPTNDLFCPDDPVTRGQIAAFINRGFLDNP